MKPDGDQTGGFTLMEMVIALGILAILLLMALPSYTDKIVRDQIAEALPLAEVAKAPVAAAWALAQVLPEDNAAAGLPVAEKIVNNFINSTAVEKGAIHVMFGNRANALLRGKVLTMRPAVVEDAAVVPVAWVCGYAPVPDKMTAKGTNRTSVPPAYLPFRCRAG